MQLTVARDAHTEGEMNSIFPRSQPKIGLKNQNKEQKT